MSKEKTFILGLGAPKTGTSWLFNNLQEQSWFQRGFVKEFHVWDGLYVPHCKGFRLDVQSRASEWLNEDFSKWQDKPAFKLLSYYTEPENYFDYFARLLDQDGVLATADLTPAYAGLSEKHLTMIQDGFAKRGIRVVAVFLMREPVSRVLSNVRMRFRSQRMNFDNDAIMDALMKRVNNPRENILSNYVRTHQNALKAFDEGDRFVSFHEILFSKSETDRLAKMLRVPEFKADFEKKFNSSESVTNLNREELDSIKENYLDRYAYVHDKFGEEIIALWDEAFDSLIAHEAI